MDCYFADRPGTSCLGNKCFECLTPPPTFGRTLPVEGREGAKLSALLPLDGGGGPKGRRG
jgi:hypothetical protein